MNVRAEMKVLHVIKEDSDAQGNKLSVNAVGFKKFYPHTIAVAKQLGIDADELEYQLKRRQKMALLIMHGRKYWYA